MADILNTVSIVAFVLAAMFMVLTAAFWIKFDIRKIIGELSGRTARKSIANMRRRNDKARTVMLK